MKQILLSIRMLLRFKVYTFVNFIGLAISLACVFTITRYIHQENTVDHCYPEYKRIYFIERSISDGTKELSGYQSDLEKDPAVERCVIHSMYRFGYGFWETRNYCKCPVHRQYIL